MSSIIKPKVLLISSRFDFSSDFVAVELKKRHVPYLRINRDQLQYYKIEFNPLTPSIIGNYHDLSFEIDNETLCSIYYRAPTFLRDIFQHDINEEEQLIRTQWM